MSDLYVREGCPHCDAAPPSRQLDMHITRAHADLPHCTARIEPERGGLYTCGFRAGHAGGEYGTWHASRRGRDLGRYVWNDTATGAKPHQPSEPTDSLDKLKAMGVLSHTVVATGEGFPERPIRVACAVLHTDAEGNTVPCPDGDREFPSGQETSMPTIIQRPPTRVYEVHTTHGDIYRAEGDVIESGDGWFTLWGNQFTLALRVPEADVRVVRTVVELDAEELVCSDTPGCEGNCCATRNIEQELKAASEAIKRLTADREEARQWARHGYEIGQRHCSWTDHGVAPGWLTEGWPRSFDSCEHLRQMAVFDEALTRVRGMSTEPEAMNAQQERPDIWRHGYHCGVLAAKDVASARAEETFKP